MMKYDGRAVQNEDTSRRWKRDSVCLILSFCFSEKKRRKKPTPPKKRLLKADVCLCFGWFIAQVETMLKDQGPAADTQQSLGGNLSFASTQLVDPPIYSTGDPSTYTANKDDGGMGLGERFTLGGSPGQSQSPFASGSPSLLQMEMGMPPMMGGTPHTAPLNWDMMAMGLEEALPAPDIIDSLYVLTYSLPNVIPERGPICVEKKS